MAGVGVKVAEGWGVGEGKGVDVGGIVFVTDITSCVEVSVGSDTPLLAQELCMIKNPISSKILSPRTK